MTSRARIRYLVPLAIAVSLAAAAVGLTSAEPADLVEFLKSL